MGNFLICMNSLKNFIYKLIAKANNNVNVNSKIAMLPHNTVNTNIITDSNLNTDMLNDFILINNSFPSLPDILNHSLTNDGIEVILPAISNDFIFIIMLL